MDERLLRSRTKTTRFTRSRIRGASLPEYAFLLVAILLVAAGAYRFLGRRVDNGARGAIAVLDSGGGAGTGAGGALGGALGNAIGGGNDPNGGGGGFFGAVRDFIRGGVLGDAGGDTGLAGAAGQIIVGMIPIVGQLADIRDIGTAVYGITQGRDGAWRDLGLASIGIIPVVGDGAKAVIRGGDEVAGAIVGAARRNGDEAVDAATSAARRQSEITGTLPGAIKRGDDGVDRVAVQGNKRMDGTRVVDEIPLDQPVYRVQEPDLPLAPHKSPFFDPSEYGLPMNKEYEVLYVSPDKAALDKLREGQGYFDQGATMHQSTVGDLVKGASKDGTGGDVMVFKDTKLEWSTGIEGYVIVRTKP